MDHADKTSSQDQRKLGSFKGQRQISHPSIAEPTAQQEPNTNQNFRKRRFSASNNPGDIMAKDSEFSATHAMVLSNQSKRASKIPSGAAQRRHLQSPSDTNPIQQVGPPKLSHDNDQLELRRSNPTSTPQWAAITPSEGYPLAPQPLRCEPMARPSLAPTMPLRIYLAQVRQLPNINTPAPHWSKPQVARSNEYPYGVRHPNTLKLRQLIRDGTLPLPDSNQMLELQQLVNGHEPRRRARRINRWKFEDLIARYQGYIDELDNNTQGNERTRKILDDRIRAFQHELRQTNIEVSIVEIFPWLEFVGHPDRIRIKQEQIDRDHEDIQARLVSIALSAPRGLKYARFMP
ncbi:MAG: hypothetical protein Q9180_004641 [Flavoplaca navasiana]